MSRAWLDPAAATRVAVLILVAVFSLDALAQDRASKQRELDEACEAVRQVRLIADQTRLIEECVENKEKKIVQLASTTIVTTAHGDLPGTTT